MNWYLLQTKANAHKIANEHLRRQGFEVFLPLVKKTSKRGSKFVNNITPLFLSYIFMGTNLTHISWKSINATRGIAKAVTLGGQYRPIDNHVIEGIKCRCDKNNIVQTISDIKPGDRVKIERGPFTDFICNVEKMGESNRAWVLIDILQRQARTKVALDDLSKMN